MLFRFSYLQLPIFFFPPALSFPLLFLSLLSVHSNLVKDYSLVIHRDCNLSNCFSTMLNFIFLYYLIIGREFERGREGMKFKENKEMSRDNP